LAEAKELSKENEEVEASTEKDAIYSVAIVTLSKDASSPTFDADRVCEDMMPNIVPDAASLWNNEFASGPLTVKFPGIADGITFHEMAHKMFLRAGTCDSMRSAMQCLKSLHAESSKPEQYLSEDFADLIASQVEGKDKNMACLFVQKTKNEDFAKLSLKNPSEGDTHSSDLFRVLHLDFLKNGKLTEQCQQALVAKDEAPTFKNCLQAK
jgi:hypothetical protein